ncbi:50S ribosomal protein P1 [Candidatus Woesearchaeota archaeon]|nr:50S ribosomal protein P1 [Candidatus Woesearchaeota archaeon]
MEYVYASMLLHSAKKEINETNLKKVLEAAGVKAEEGRIKALVAALEGVDIEQAIKEAAMPVAVAAPVQAHAQTAPAAKKEEKKTEEEAAGSLAALFG